jgi:hypothetical protein
MDRVKLWRVYFFRVRFPLLRVAAVVCTAECTDGCQHVVTPTPIGTYGMTAKFGIYL